MTSSPAPLPHLDKGLAELAAGKDLLLCDVWGVIHNGVIFHPAAVEALSRFRQGGGTVILVTNAPAPEAQVWSRMRRLGVPRECFDRIATSGDVAAATLVEAGCPPVFNIGPDHDVALYGEAERLGPRKPRRVGVGEAELALCIALDTTGDRPEDYDAVLATLRGRGLTMVCANPDIVVEVGDELVYCAGAIAERYEAIGGTVVQTGKPFPAIYARARAMAAETRGAPTSREHILAIGDAVHTDMRGAAREGIDALMITAGIHRAALHGGRDSPLDHAALRQFLGDAAITPLAALGGLAWTV